MGWELLFEEWLGLEIAEKEALFLETAVLTGLYTAQWVIYYLKANEQIDKRDDIYDREELINEELHRRYVDVDFPRAIKRADIIDLAIPEADLCGDSTLYVEEGVKDAIPFSGLKDDILKCLPNRVPDNWTFNDSELTAGLGVAYSGAILANSAKRREETFRENKTSLVLSAQRANRMDADTFFKDLNVASNIYSGLANFYMSGINSAARGLGQQIGKFAGDNGSSSQSQQQSPGA